MIRVFTETDVDPAARAQFARAAELLAGDRDGEARGRAHPRRGTPAGPASA